MMLFGGRDARHRFRALAQRQPQSEGELAQLVQECLDLALAIREQPGLSNATPHIVWHFLSDADIRFKDERYAEAQLGGLRTALQKWESADEQRIR